MSTEQPDALYVAVLVNEITVEGPGHVPEYEESIVLLRAGSDEDATRSALAHAREAQTSYHNEDGEVVRWSFRQLAAIGRSLADDLDPEQLRAGTEIFSRFFRDLDAYRTADGSPDAARWSPEPLDRPAPGGRSRH